ncbi:hypothetical protein MKW92_027723, partial [Papaver armeniacum]
SHAGNKLAMQEFMIFPVGAESSKKAMKTGVEVYHNLKYNAEDGLSAYKMKTKTKTNK